MLIVISTSYLDEAEACERLVYLDAGRVVAFGPPAELRASVPLDLYRAWADDPRAVARAARALPCVASARATGRFVRVEVARDARARRGARARRPALRSPATPCSSPSRRRSTWSRRCSRSRAASPGREAER